MDSYTSIHASKCLLDLMMKDPCAVCWSKKQALHPVNPFMSLEYAVGVRGQRDLVEPIAHVEFTEYICTNQLVSNYLWQWNMVFGTFCTYVVGSGIYVHPYGSYSLLFTYCNIQYAINRLCRVYILNDSISFQISQMDHESVLVVIWNWVSCSY